MKTKKTKPSELMKDLICDMEIAVLKLPVTAKMVQIDGEDLLIMIEYTRQLEAILSSNDQDPKSALIAYRKS